VHLPRLRLVAALLVAAPLTAACDASVTETCIGGPCTLGGGGCGPGPAEGDYPCDVFTVIEAQCLYCHKSPPAGGAPFPLLTYEDTQQPFSGGSTLIYQQMHDQIQPGAVPQMPYMAGMLPAADFATLDGWLTACAPPMAAGTGCGCPGQDCMLP
jgi:hypothetical protein